MRVRTTTKAIRMVAAVGLAVGVGVGVGGLGGCHSGDPEPVGSLNDSGLTATYSMGTMTTDVTGGRVGVREVASAAEASFRRRGYTVRSSSISDDGARVAGSEVGSGNFQATIVSASNISNGVRIEVHCEPFGDQDKSREFMNDVLGRLGL